MILRLWDSLRAARPLCCLIYMSNIVRMFLELKENKEADRSHCPDTHSGHLDNRKNKETNSAGTRKG